MAASPAFSMNAGGSLAKLSIAASGAITATLDSVVGVRSVAWSISRTDDTTTSGSYTLVQSGSVGQTVDFNAAGAGTAGILRCVINGGISNETDQPSSTTRAEAKFFVPTAGGDEVLVQDEIGDKQDPDRTSDPVFGPVLPLNGLIRAGGGSSSDIQISDNTTNAFRVRESTNDYFNVDTTNASESITIGGTAIQPAIGITGTTNINDGSGTSQFTVTAAGLTTVRSASSLTLAPATNLGVVSAAAFAPAFGFNFSGAQTTNATITTALAFAMASDGAVNFTARVVFRSSTDGDSGSTTIHGTAERSGGTVSIVGTSVAHATAQDGGWGTVQGAPVVVDASGIQIRVRVEGQAGDTVQWNVTFMFENHQTS